MAGSLTRIRNNQVSTAVSGNTILGINASQKVQPYTITGGLLANSLTYGSDLTISGNLTINGTTTAVNTTTTTIEDPVITLASTAVGTPVSDIGFIGQRGSSTNVAWVWKESALEFESVYTSTGNVSNGSPTVTVTGFANIHMGNANIGGNAVHNGTTSFVGNILGTASFTANVVAGNVLTPGLISATGSVTGGNVLTGGYVSAAGNLYGTLVSVSGNVSGGNILATTVSASGNITGGNILFGSGVVSGTGTVAAAIVSASGNIYGANVVATGNILPGANVTYNLGSPTAQWKSLYISGNTIYMNTIQLQQPAGSANTLQVTAADGSTLGGLNIATLSASGNITGGNLLSPGLVSATANITGGNILTAGLISATSTITSAANVTGGNITTAGQVSATANITGGNILTAGIVSSTGNAIHGNVLTAGAVSATGNINGGNLTIATNATILGNLSVAGNVTFTNSNVITTNDLYLELANNATTYAQINGAGLNVGLTGTPLTNWTYNSTANAWTTNVAISATATVTGGNLATAGTISGTGNVTGGNILTAGLVSATGNITGGNILNAGIYSGVGNVTIPTSSYYFGNGSQLTGVQASTSGFPVTAGTSNIAAATNGNIAVTVGGTANTFVFASTGAYNTGFSSVTGNVIAGNLTTAGQVTATANITGGNITTAGQVSATANIIGGNILTGGLISATSTITSAANVIGGNITTAGQVTATANITGGNILTAGIISTSGNIYGANLVVSSIESVTGNITGGNILTAGIVSATGNIITTNGNVIGGNVIGGNVVITGNSINMLAAGGTLIHNSANANTNFAVNGTTANVFFVNASTNTASFGSSAQTTNAVVAFNATNSILLPVGNTNQRPGTGVSGMLRFNSLNNALEIYNNTTWQSVGATQYTTIVDEQFNGDGTNTAFTLSTGNLTSAATLVSINGIVQIPTGNVAGAYAVTGNSTASVLTFTEAPAVGDQIDVRELATTSTVSAIYNNQSQIIANGSASELDITGNIIPTANVTYNLGSPTAAFKSLYVGGNTVYLGSLQLKDNGSNALAVYTSDGTTLANVAAAGLAVTSITDGTSAYQFAGVNGNAIITAGGANTLTVTSSGIVTSGTSSVSGSITGGNILTGGLISATGNITGGNISTGGTMTITGASQAASYSTAGNVTGGNVLTAGIVSVGSNIVIGGNINATGNAVANIGSLANQFNYVFARATSAQYADLAEMYAGDAAYEPGTVVDFGGDQEVTLSSEDMSSAVAGVVSTNPSYLMNSGLVADNTVAVALTGRVPTRVTGPVAKGDLMVSAGDGTARSEEFPAVGTVIGKALANFDGDVGVIEVVVGRF